MVTKEKVLSAVDKMPAEFDLDDLIERLIFIEKVEQGIKQSSTSQGITHEDVVKTFNSWSK